MRKFIAIVVAGVLLPSMLGSCGSKKKSPDTTVAAVSSETTVAPVGVETSVAAAPAETTPAAVDTTIAGAASGEVTAAPAQTGTPISVDATETSDTAYAYTFSAVTAPAGKVTFTFKNSGQKQHEMIILKTDEPVDALKVGSDNKVSEDASVGEIPEIDAGQTATKTFDLEAGKYVFVCNIEKHYGLGMRTAFTVA